MTHDSDEWVWFLEEDDVSDDLLSVRDWCLQGPLSITHSALKWVFQVG